MACKNYPILINIQQKRGLIYDAEGKYVRNKIDSVTIIVSIHRLLHASPRSSYSGKSNWNSGIVPKKS